MPQMKKKTVYTMVFANSLKNENKKSTEYQLFMLLSSALGHPKNFY
jgi:hypothetical protein